MRKHTARLRYTRRRGTTYVSCTRCGVNLVPAPTSFEEDPVCATCHTSPASQRRHFAALAGGLAAAWLAVVVTVLGWEGIATLVRAVWDMISPF
ncbi:hypothetical protein [Streptomyces sp. NPDC048825]|uniref:hypothetical protein n=1 Tax=Streptomyces sp. NPDC048825 TaxID=3365592 RepID=UPI003720369B